MYSVWDSVQKSIVFLAGVLACDHGQLQSRSRQDLVQHGFAAEWAPLDGLVGHLWAGKREPELARLRRADCRARHERRRVELGDHLTAGVQGVDKDSVGGQRARSLLARFGAQIKGQRGRGGGGQVVAQERDPLAQPGIEPVGDVFFV